MTMFFIIMWVACGVLAYGGTLGYFQNKFPTLRSKSDMIVSSLMGVTGPIGLLVSFFLSDFFKRGLVFIPLPEMTPEEIRDYYLGKRRRE